MGKRNATRIVDGVDGVVLGEAKRERRLAAVEWTKWVMGLACFLCAGSVGEAMNEDLSAADGFVEVCV